MLKTLKSVALTGLVLTAFNLHAQVTHYERDATRAALMDLPNKPPTRLVIVGEPKTPQATAFLNFYTEKVFPKLQEIENLYLRYHSLHLLRDSGSQLDEAELAKWTAEYDAIEAEDNALSVDKEWTATLRTFADLSTGLEGPLAEEARRMYRDRELESFPEDMKPKLDEISLLTREWQDAIRESKASKDLPRFVETIMTARRQFKTGEITLEEASQKIRGIFNEAGQHFVGYEAAQTKGANLNRIAVLRTELAKSKGFPSWADYMLAMNGQGYTPEYRGTKAQKEFLTNYLKALKPVQDKFMAERLKEMGLEDKKDQFSMQEIGLLTPPGVELLQPYFPKEKITGIWEKTLLESGFRPETLKQILVDDTFRPSKNPTEAYLATARSPYNETEEIDAVTLSYIPMIRTKPQLKDGLVYILQSWKGMGIGDLRTAFHEGGHATEKLLKFKDEPLPESYGYAEVPSLTSEYFTKDPEVIFNNLTPDANGKMPTYEEVCKLLSNYRKVDVINVAGLASQSLFDLELWSVDYTAPGAPTFLKAVEDVSKKTEALSEVFPDLVTKVPYHFSNIATGHFTSGSVRNIGYDFATIGAAMMAEFFSDELEKVSGRRGWYQQPEFGRIYEEKFASQGWRKLFPANIESITGRKFDYMAVVNDFTRRIAGEEACASKLK